MEVLKLRSIVKRKSSMIDMFFVMVFLIAVIFFLLILARAWEGGIKDPLDTALSNQMPSDGVNISKTLDQVSTATFLMDSMIPFLLIGLIGFVMLGAAAYMQHPVMLFIGIILIAVAILLGGIYANVYEQIADTSTFEETSSSLPISRLLMKGLPIVLILIGVAVTVTIIWSKKGGGGGGL